VTWNVNNINSNGRELALGNLLAVNDVDVADVTEVKLGSDSTFPVDGYITFSPLVKKRVLLLVKAEIATGARLRKDLMDESGQAVYVHIDTHERTRGGRTAQHGATLFAAVYRTWTDSMGQTGPKAEKPHLANLIEQIEKAAESTPRFVLMGDFNLDVGCKDDATYGRR
jgi:exonuclease III